MTPLRKARTDERLGRVLCGGRKGTLKLICIDLLDRRHVVQDAGYRSGVLRTEVPHKGTPMHLCEIMYKLAMPADILLILFFAHNQLFILSKHCRHST